MDTGLDENEEQLIDATPETEPDVPIPMLLLAGTKDFLDVLDLSLVLIIITTLLTLMITPILFLWVMGRLRGSWWKKIVIRMLALQVLEFLPIMKIVPGTTIIVWMAHSHEKEWVRAFNAALEEYISNTRFGRRR